MARWIAKTLITPGHRGAGVHVVVGGGVARKVIYLE